MSDYKTILGERRDAVTLITLNRPEALNALNAQVLADLLAALAAFDADASQGCAVLTGSAKAFAYGVAPIPAAVMGVVTGCVGGIIRDVVANRPSIIMRPELYVTAAALAAGLCATGLALGFDRALVWPVAVVAGFGLRAAAIRFGLSLPSHSGAEGDLRDD